MSAVLRRHAIRRVRGRELRSPSLELGPVLRTQHHRGIGGKKPLGDRCPKTPAGSRDDRRASGKVRVS